MNKEADTNHPIHEHLSRRWSPYAFSDRDVRSDDLLSLLEAARWAPSSYNEQPWNFIVGRKSEPEQHNKILSCLVEGNQAWAKNAPVLMLTVASLRFARNGKENDAAIHDIGLAAANLTHEATARGISVHQMIGILPEKAREVFDIPADYRAVTAIAIGYLASPGEVDDSLHDRDEKPRQRKELKEFVFGAKFGAPASFI